jgi:hypothetical protein
MLVMIRHRLAGEESRRKKRYHLRGDHCTVKKKLPLREHLNYQNAKLDTIWVGPKYQLEITRFLRDVQNAFIHPWARISRSLSTWRALGNSELSFAPFPAQGYL